MMTRLIKYPLGTTLLLVGTRHGLFLLSSRDRTKWLIEETTLPGSSHTNYAFVDPRNHARLFATLNEEGRQPSICYSENFGQSWHTPQQELTLPASSGLTLREIWYIEPGRPNEPQTLYAGADPASLWISTDYGATWEPNQALLAHPDRASWSPIGAGTSVHSIIADPSHSQRMWIGISEGGCLRSEDNGQSWQAINRKAAKQGSTETIGLGSHRLIHHPDQPTILYQQNREGLYKSIDAGDSWSSIQNNLPSPFGFPLAIDSHHPDTVFAVVADPQERYNLGDQFVIYRSQNGGQHWTTLTEGLPGGPGMRLKVLRHALCTDSHNPCGVYVGTTTGHVFASTNRGDTWHMIANFLPPIYSITAAVL